MKRITNTTLFIPTRNRPEYLKRALEYYSKFGMTIIIGDSSTKSAHIKGKNITYYHKKDWGFTEKIISCLKKVKTKYVIMCADDDFIVPPAVERGTQFLEKNPSYTSVQGRYVSFTKGKKLNIRPINTPAKSITGNTSDERMHQVTQNYMHQTYALHHAKNLVRTYIKAKKIRDYNFLEVFVAFASSIIGKNKIINEFYLAREYIETSAGRTTDGFELLMTKKEHKKERQEFMNMLIESLMEKESFSRKKAEGIIRQRMKEFLIETEKTTKNVSFFKKMLRHFPKKATQRFVRYLLAKKAIVGALGKKGYPYCANRSAKKSLKIIVRSIKNSNV